MNKSNDLKIEVISHRLSESDGKISIYDNIGVKFRYFGKEVSVDGLNGSYARELFLFDGESIDKMIKLTTEVFEVRITSLGPIWIDLGKVMKESIELSAK